MWIVRLIKPPVPFLWRPDYSPRRFAYKADALTLAAQIRARGGEARVEKVKQ